MKVKIKRLREGFTLPEYQTRHSAAMDGHAAIDEPIIVKPMERKLIPLGFSIELPDGYEIQIRARSGLAIKHGITMANGIGTIDADYRGEYMAMVFNISDEEYEVKPNERICQMVLSKFEKAQWQEVDELSESERGAGGFGSTGK